ncbi:MAG: hypothetical protein AAF467_13745 [Actinomycetota bacterium]
MTRPAGQVESRPERIPTLRERKPFTFWMVMLGAVVLVLGLFSSFLSAFL